MGQVRAAKLDEFDLRQIGAGLQHHQRFGHFSPCIVGKRVLTAASRTAGCASSAFSTSSDEYVLAAADDDVLLAIHNEALPSSFIVAISPVWNQPPRMTSRVACG